MADKEGFFERMQREEREARLAAGIAELKRRIAAGEFPDNDDTVNAFSAGFYATYEYQQARREAAEGGTNMRLLAFATGLIGLILNAFYILTLYLRLPTNGNEVFMPIIGVALCGIGLWAGRRSRDQWRAAQAAHREKWG